MAECCYPKCYSCKLEYCIKDNVLKPKTPKKDRSEYFAKRYQENKDKYHEYYLEYNKESAMYVRWMDVKKSITRLKKQIGEVNYELVMGEFEKIERVKKKNITF